MRPETEKEKDHDNASFATRLQTPAKLIPPPSEPGLSFEFCPIGHIPRDGFELWDNRTGRWRPAPVTFTQPINPADSHLRPYGWYRQKKLT